MSNLPAVATEFKAAYGAQIDQVLQTVPAIEAVGGKAIHSYELTALLQLLRAVDPAMRNAEKLSRGGYAWDDNIDFDHMPHVDLYTDGTSALAWLQQTYLTPLKTVTAPLYARQIQHEELTDQEQATLNGYETLCGLAQRWKDTGDLQKLSEAIDSDLSEHKFTHFVNKPSTSHADAALESRKAAGARGVA